MNLQKMDFSQFSIEIYIFRKFEDTTHTHKYEKIHWDWLWKGFYCLSTGAAHNWMENVWFCSGGLSYKTQEKFTAWRVNATLTFTQKTDITLTRHSLIGIH